MNKLYKNLISICVILITILFASCVSNDTNEEDSWGSFSAETKQYSYDDNYYSIQEIKDDMIYISVYSTSDDELVFDVEPCRAIDYWGMVWENDRYAIWIQSGDIGVFCYELEDDVWQLNNECEKPEEIVSRYDILFNS